MPGTDILPSLKTSRLLLRPFQPSDAAAVQHYVSDREIAATTRGIEHPYPDGAASEWIATHAELHRTGRAVIFAILPGDSWKESIDSSAANFDLLGSIGLHIDPEDHRAELGYWTARPWWNRGIASEAAPAIIQFGFSHLGLNRIYAHHMTRNPASGRVLENAGMIKEGTLRQHARKWGEFNDIVLYGILAADFNRAT